MWSRDHKFWIKYMMAKFPDEYEVLRQYIYFQSWKKYDQDISNIPCSMTNFRQASPDFFISDFSFTEAFTLEKLSF